MRASDLGSPLLMCQGSCKHVRLLIPASVCLFEKYVWFILQYWATCVFTCSLTVPSHQRLKIQMLQCRVTNVGHLVKYEFQRSNNSFFSISMLLVILELAHNKKKMCCFSEIQI